MLVESPSLRYFLPLLAGISGVVIFDFSKWRSWSNCWIRHSIEPIEAIVFVCAFLSVFLGEAVLPTPLAKLLLWNIERRIYSDISGYTRIYSDRKYIDRHLQSQDGFDYTNWWKPGLTICIMALRKWLKIQGNMFRIIHIKQCLDIKVMGAYFLTILRSD